MIDWEDFRNKSEALSAEEIKQRLDPEFVMGTYGVQVQDINGRRAGVCPFHSDHKPSFDIYERSGVKRVGCFPCGLDGDVIDLIGWFEKCEFGQAMTKANELLRQQEGSNFAPVAVEQRPAIAKEVIADVVFEATNNDLTPFATMAEDRNWPIDPEWVRDAFEVGCIGDEVIIPHKDASGQWSGYKIRTGKDKYAAPGSRFTTFYAGWRDQGRPNVVICEGEPDTWAVTAAVGDRYDVLGLATGTGMNPREDLIAQLAGRSVVLAFDGDDSGRRSTKRWVDGISNHVNSVSIIPLQDGFDMCMVPDIGRAVEESKALLPYTGTVVTNGSIFQRLNEAKKTVTSISNWVFEPSKELKSPEGGVAYEGRIFPTNKIAVITSDDLSSSSKMHSWAQHYGVGWRGSDIDARDILIWLESQGPYLSPGKMTRVLGLHEGHFILPEETIGKDRWVYLPKPGIVTKHLDFNFRPGWQAMVEPLFNLHTRAVMDPLLSWLAAAFVRSLLDEFPILAVTGSSGAGKTTLLKTVTQAFGGAVGGKDGISLADTTKHAITENVGATNAVPVWFDEYRASIKSDTRDALHNSLLAAYIGQTTSKGAVTDRGLGVTNWEHNAPIIISGENTFTETAHVERMVLLALPQKGRSFENLEKVQSLLPSGFSQAYLYWLIYRADLNNVKAVPFAGDLPPRVRSNLGVLQMGWALLDEFLADHQIAQLPRPDYSLIIGEAYEAMIEDPVLEAVRWAVESAGSLPEVVAIVKGAHVYIRVESLVALTNRDRRFALPGNAKAIRRLLIEKYNGADVREPFPERGFPTPTRFTRLLFSDLGITK